MTSSLIQSVQGALTAKKDQLGALWGVFNAPEAPDAKLREKVVLPAQVVLTPEQEKALKELPELLAGYVAPKERRELTPRERRSVLDLLPVLRDVETVAKAVRASLRTTVFNHGDVVLEREGKVDERTPREKDGHYLVKDEDDFVLGGVPVAITRSVTAPKTTTTAEALLANVAEKPSDTAITHKEYLAVTESVRVFEEGALLRYLAKHPERAKAFVAAMSTSGGSLSMLESVNQS